jgi:N-acetylglucosaminyldiphosphoundecaprenol N-acetyl-beta-D-mannosaminyltransferase
LVDRVTRLRILGVPIDVMRFDDAVNAVIGWMAAPASRTAHFCNVHLAVSAYDSRKLLETLESGSFNATDGMPLVWMARRLGARGERVAGPDLMLAVMDRGRALGARHYLYGGARGVAGALERRLVAQLPGLLVVGAASPPFRPSTAAELEADLARIQVADADFVWVGLGAPKQEYWVERARRRLRVAGILAVGAAFDFHSGWKRRAPRWMQRTGTEWLFRLAIEPRRLWRRYLVTNARFILLAVRQSIRGGSGSRDRSGDA